MRRLRWSSIGVNRIRIFGLVGFFFVTFRFLFLKKKKKKKVFGLFAWSTFSMSSELGWNGWKRWVPSAAVEQVSIFGQNALTSIFKCCVIRHLHISHNAPKILHNLCSSFLPGITSRPKRNWKQCLWKILGCKWGALWEMCKRCIHKFRSS